MAAADTIKEINVTVKRCAECGARFGIDAAFCPFDGTALSTSTWDRATDPRARITVDDRYEVLEPLGEGGMGTVYAVRHVKLDRRFAMKVLRRDLAADSDLAARFLQEAKATAAIAHPAVVAITDFGTMDDGSPYFVMELLEGETLATRIRARGPLPPATAMGIAKRIAEALEASHAANVIHRDLKPDNVFLVGKGAAEDIRIVDFGAAKIVGGSKLTRPGIVFGTPYYMSPEQASGEAIDARADVYSLGILLFEMVTGRVPFEADSYMGVLTKHIFEAPPPLVVPSGSEPGDLEGIVMRALQKAPAARYASMSAFARALDDATLRERTASPKNVERARQPTLKLGSMTTADRIQRSVSLRVEAEANRKRRGVLVAVLATCGLLAVGAALVAVTGSTETAASARTAAPPPSVQMPAPSATAASDPEVASPGTASAASKEPEAAPAASADPTAPATAALPASAAVTAKRSPPSASPAPSAQRAAPVAPRSPPRLGGADDFKDPWKR
ncbi:MAG: hypothetical protein BGO98_46870 [Myxococcales bacterium 68-20]|nr:MAG: hypothetical protein BGO98_46870 [Myxococcales bacterium 68-20]